MIDRAAARPPDGLGVVESLIQGAVRSGHAARGHPPHHRDHRRRAAQRRLLRARARAAAGQEDRQPGRPDRLPPLLRRRGGRAGLDLTFFEYPGAAARPAGRGHGPPDRLARRLAGGARLLGASAWATRASRPRRDGGALRFADPEGLEHELRVAAVADAPLIAGAPEVPDEHALQGFDAVRAYAADPARERAAARARRSASSRAGDGAWEARGERRGGAIVYDAPTAGAGAAARAPCTTSRGRPDGRPARRWQRARDRAPARTADAGHRPLLLPLGLLPRAQRRAVRARDDRARASPSTSRAETLGERLSLPPRFERCASGSSGVLTPLPDTRPWRRAGAATPPAGG